MPHGPFAADVPEKRRIKMRARSVDKLNPETVKRTRWLRAPVRAVLFFAALVAAVAGGPAAAQEKKPNILVIMGDDVGWFNIGAYHRGIMSGKTPSLDKLASQGMMFTDYYAEASCTAGRANFITGEIPLRTGLT
jgi:arylsulfatase